MWNRFFRTVSPRTGNCSITSQAEFRLPGTALIFSVLLIACYTCHFFEDIVLAGFPNIFQRLAALYCSLVKNIENCDMSSSVIRGHL